MKQIIIFSVAGAPSNAAEIPVKFQSDTIIVTSNIAASRFHEILRQNNHPLSE